MAGVEMVGGRKKGKGGRPLTEIDEMAHVREREEYAPAGPRANGPFSRKVIEDYNDTYKMPIRTPLHVKINFIPVMLLLLYIAASAFYFYIRITKTLVTGPVFVYGIIVLVIEFLGLSASLPYALLLTISLLPKGTATGLPTEQEAPNTTERFNFKVRCLIPCYKEPLEVIQATVTAALNADIPVGATRTVYLCDDGNSKDKADLVAELIEKGHDCQYVSQRVKKGKETNGKSSNLNNCLQNVIYKDCKRPGSSEIDWELIPETEILVVFDADMVAKKHFFVRILEPLTNPKYALCLSPQSFHNINPHGDLFNNINLQFWEYWLPGAVAWGYIACTGTNFAIRVKPLAHCGWFPTYTITEDYALGMELKMHGYQGSYLLDYLAPGEAPDEVRNVMRQRSRWCKGHMQVFFSWAMCPLLQWRLSLPMKLWYSYGTWTYIVNIFSVPMALLIPFLSLGFGLNPVVVNYWFAAAATPYYACIFLVQTYFHKLDHIKSLWFAGISNVVLSFTYTKAVMNVLLSKGGLKEKGGFKATVKKATEPAAANPLAALKRQLTRILSRGRPTPEAYDHPKDHFDSPNSVRDFPDGGRTPSTPGVTVHGDQTPPGQQHGPVHVTVVVNNPHRDHEAEPLMPVPPPPPKKRAPWPKRLASVFSPKNLVDMGGVLDPAVLFIMLAFCVAVIGMGIWRTATNPSGGRGARYVSLSPYIGLPMLWSVYNAIPPFLFCFYCFTSGKPFVRAAGYLRLLGTLAVIGAVCLLWLTVPIEFDMKGATSMAGKYITQQSQSAAQLKDSALLESGVTKELTGGWLIGADPVRYGMPLATGASLLAWSMVEFPDGFKAAGAYDSSADNVIAAATYMLNNLDTTTDSNNPVFIAQVGDPLAYVTVPRTNNATWTRFDPLDDPALQGPRPAFTLDSTHVGVDLLAESAAALALASLVARQSGRDAAQADAFLQGARDLYKLAKSTPGAEQSYCDFIACDANITTTKIVPVVPLPQSANKDPASIKCWTPDYPRATCAFVSDDQPSLNGQSAGARCLDAAAEGPVFKRRSSCCAYMRTSGVWENQTTPQGPCALPEGQFDCWIPQLQVRTCTSSSIDLTTGTGCTGLGQDFFPSPESCCNQLVKSQAITTVAPGRGVCAKGPDTCFVPDKLARTCRQIGGNTTGDQCGAFGADQQFDSSLLCCNSLVVDKTISSKLPGTGICADTATSCFVVDLVGKRCIQLPNATATTATCASFGSDYRFPDKTSCCNGLFLAVGGFGPFFDESCRPAPTPPAPTPEPTLPKETAAALPVETAAALPVNPAVPGTRRRLNQEGGDADMVLWGEGTGEGGVAGSASGSGSLPGGRKELQAKASAAAGGSPGRRLLQAELPPFLNVPDSALAGQQQMLIPAEVNVKFYPSTSVLDDVAWAGAALFMATGEEEFLGEAQEYLQLHLTREAEGQRLIAEAGYYVYNYDTAVWGVAAILAKLTDLPQYHTHIRTFLKAWVELKPPKLDPQLLASKQLASQFARQQNQIKENLQTFNNQTFLVFDGCTPDRNNTPAAKRLAAQLALNRTATGPVVFGDPLAVTFEQDCSDGLDNDCDGLIDMDDPDCPFLPVQATNLELAWTKDTPLPNAAAASYLALLYSTLNITTGAEKRKLQCWALAQLRYMMGENRQKPDAISFIVGFGKGGYKRPIRIPDRPSSCPVDVNQPCTFESAFFPGLPNPQLGLIAGALVAGPDMYDNFVDDRTSNATRVGADMNAAFMAAMAGILGTGTDVKTCGQLSGVYEDVFGDVAL